MPKNYCIMQIWAESGKSALPICNYSQILYQFLTFTQNLKRSLLSTNTNIIYIIVSIDMYFKELPEVLKSFQLLPLCYYLNLLILY